MKQQNKIRISSELTFIRIVMLFLIGLCLYEIANSDLDTDFKTEWEFRVFLVFGIVLLIYFLTFKNIYYSGSNLNLKNIFQKEEVVSFKNIRSIENQYTGSGLSYKIFYTNQKGHVSSAFFFARSAEKLSEFIESVKLINPLFETE